MDKLSEKEKEVLKLVAIGLNNEEISLKINTTIHTVKAHISSIMKKLEVGNRTKAAYYAYKYKLLDDDEIY